VNDLQGYSRSSKLPKFEEKEEDDDDDDDEFLGTFDVFLK